MLRIDNEAGLQNLPEGTEDRIEVTCLHRVIDLVGAIKRLHRALRPRGILIVAGPEGEACWNDPRAKRQIQQEAFLLFDRNSKEEDYPHFFFVNLSPGQVELTK